MSQGFNYTFDRMKESNPTNPDDPQSQETQPKEADYPSGSNTRNVCFVFPDSNRIFLNYGYLVSGEYRPEDGEIVLSFTTHVLTLRGVRLESLFYDFLDHLPRQIVCTDIRYNDADDGPCVNGIVVKE